MDEIIGINLTLVNQTIKPYVPLGQNGLLPALQAAQKIHGWLPKQVTQAVAKALHVPLADVYGVIKFYGLFYDHPIGKSVIRVCTDPACSLKGADNIYDQLCRENKSDLNNPNSEIALRVEKSTCLGLCEHAPALMLNDDVVSNPLTSLNEYLTTFPKSIVFGNGCQLTKNCGNGKPTPIIDYGDYSGFIRASKITPEAVINEVIASGLVGRGGAAFPTGVKWDGARKATGKEKYIICNADESEPGTFKDRILLSDDPHMIIEGMCIAAYAIGARHGFIYLRGEYAYIVPIIENALAESRQTGYLNQNFDIEIRLGAGAYICGEETALFESMEGKRGFPRVKPPFPTTHGLFGQPTVINNVETLSNIPLIFRKGASEYRQQGTQKSPGPKLFCLSGDIKNPGLYEVPFGISLQDILEMAGGVSAGNHLQAVLFGGAAGAFATPEQIKVKLTFEDLRSAGLPLGSGVIMVFDDTRDILDILQRLGSFFAHESCGKCYPCQLGTQKQMEIIDRFAGKEAFPGDMERLLDVGWTMTDASLCGLGQTAASATISAIKQFPQLFATHKKEN